MVKPPYAIQVLDRAAAILDVLARTPDARLPDIAASCALHRATAFRILSSLESHGLARRTAGGGWALGPRVVQLGALAYQEVYPGAQLRPLLAQLADATRLTAQVWVRTGTSALCLDQCDSPTELRVTSRVGRSLPLHTSSPGKVLLAWAPDAVRDEVLAGPLATLAGKPVSRDELLGELQAIRTIGHKFAVAEVSSVMASLAVPVPGRHGEITTALNLLGTTADLVPARVTALVPVLLDAATRFAAELGHVSSPA